MPANTPFFIEADSDGSWNDSYPVIVDGKTKVLYLDGAAEVDAGNSKPTTPLGLVGIMRAETIDTDGNIVSFFVADLRFIKNHELPVANDIDEAPNDAEEFNNWEASRKDLRQVAAFVAPIPGTPAPKDGIIPALYYGAEEYYGILDVLRAHGDKIITKGLKRQRRNKKLAKTVTEQSVDIATTPAAQSEQKSPRRFFNRKK